jgi:flagellin-like hook-associated protein FlgL
VGSRIETLEQVESRLADREVSLEESLSGEFDADLAETITHLARVSATYQAILQMTAHSFQLRFQVSISQNRRENAPFRRHFESVNFPLHWR